MRASHGDDEAEVRLHHPIPRRLVTGLDPLRERDLLGGREESMPADLAQVLRQRVRVHGATVGGEPGSPPADWPGRRAKRTSSFPPVQTLSRKSVINAAISS